MKNSKIRILIVDDHEVVRTAYRLLLEKEGMEVVKDVGTGSEGVDAVLELKPDIVLLDISMPDIDGLAALTMMRYLQPDVRVVMLTAHEDEMYMARAGELGAVGYFSKRVPPKELTTAIKSIGAGKSSPVIDALTEKVTPPTIPGIPVYQPTPQPKNDLTDQEAVVVSLLSMGCTNEEITEQLYVSRNTLKTHLRNIYSKLNVSDRTQAAVWAVRNGFGPYAKMSVN
jgi:DNA-binding NarL/FixJ family response regulator